MHGFDERERLLADYFEHLLGWKILEMAPTNRLAFLSLWKHTLPRRNAHHLHLLDFQFFVIKGFHEHEICQLHDDFNGVGDTTLPHALPDVIDLVLYGSGNHGFPSFCVYSSYSTGQKRSNAQVTADVLHSSVTIQSQLAKTT